MGGLEASPLVDCDVDEDRVPLHRSELLARDDVGSLRPFTRTAPITRSASRRRSSRASVEAKQVETLFPKCTSSSRRRSRERSYRYTSAPSPSATLAAFSPTTPPPMTMTRADATPATP